MDNQQPNASSPSNGRVHPCPTGAHSSGNCTCNPNISLEDLERSADEVRAFNEKLHASPEWKAAEASKKAYQDELREKEEREREEDVAVEDWLVIKCKKCGNTERVPPKGAENMVLMQLCAKCYRDAYTKANREKPVKCKGCKEPFAKTLLDADGRCNACQIEVDPEPNAPNSKPLYQAQGTTKSGSLIFSVMTHKASTVTPKVLKWIWKDRIPAGKITLLNGAQGGGKSLLFCDIIGHVTTGSDFYDSKNTFGARKVLLASTEDDEDDTIIPRLMAAGANLDNVEIMDKLELEEVVMSANGGVISRGKKTKKMLDLKLHTKLLKGIIKNHPDVALILLDPITAFLGVDECKDKEARPVLESIAEALKGSDCSLLGIIHSNKMTSGSAGDKVKGGSSMLGVPRAAWAIGRDPQDKTQRYMALIKANGVKQESGLKFTIENKVLDEKTGLEAGYVVWQGVMEENANEMLIATREVKDVKDSKEEAARVFILAAITDAPAPSRPIYEALEAQGVQDTTVKRAMKSLGLHHNKTKGWWISLPPNCPKVCKGCGTTESDSAIADQDVL
jgi:putative DNA primase/helicase